MSDKMTLTKADITASISQLTSVSRLEADRMVEYVIETIIKSLSQRTEIKLSGFGKFKIIHKKPRPGRNPRTGVPVEINERYVVTFRAGNKLKRQLEEGSELTSS